MASRVFGLKKDRRGDSEIEVCAFITQDTEEMTLDSCGTLISEDIAAVAIYCYDNDTCHTLTVFT